MGARVLVMSHLGRPEEGVHDAEFSLAPVASRLSELLGVKVRLVRDWLDGVDCEPGEVVLLENVRFNEGEKKNSDELARRMAALCDVYVMDAFATAHRAEASTHGVAKFAPVACAGPLLIGELEALEKALDAPKRPLVAIVGGSKVSTKLTVLENLLGKVDRLIVGGGIANTFLAAAGHPIGKSLHEADMVGVARELLARSRTAQVEIPLPSDVVVAREFAASAEADVKAVARRRGRRHDPRHRPGHGGSLCGDAQGRGHDRLERAGRRVRVRPVRRRHAGASRRRSRAARHSRSQAVATRSPRSRSTAWARTSPTSPPPAAPSSSSSRARSCRRSTCWNAAPRPEATGMLRRTKIVATLGPATDAPGVLEDVIRRGADVVRLNFSHGAPGDHEKRVQAVRAASERAGKHVAVLGDLQGPKIRIERFAEGRVVLNEGEPFVLDPGIEAHEGTAAGVGITYDELARDVRPGDELILGDGQVELVVVAVRGARVESRVTVGGEVSDHKGINRRGGGLSAKALTDKDREDVRTAAALEMDYLAVSFVRQAARRRRGAQPCCALPGAMHGSSRRSSAAKPSRGWRRSVARATPSWSRVATSASRSATHSSPGCRSASCRSHARTTASPSRRRR